MFRVRISPECRAQFTELRDYIAARSTRRTASNYLRRLKDHCNGLAVAPHRGERREGIKFDQRTIGFDRRVSIIFEVRDADRLVNIVGIRYAGQSLEQRDR